MLSTPLSSTIKIDEEMLGFRAFPRFSMFNYISYTLILIEQDCFVYNLFVLLLFYDL